MVLKTRELRIAATEDEATLFHEMLKRKSKDLGCKLGERVPGCCFESRPDEDGYSFSLDMWASSDGDETPCVELTIWDKEHKFLFSDVVDIGISNLFYYPAVPGGIYHLRASFATKPMVAEFARKLIKDAGFELMSDSRGFRLVSRKSKEQVKIKGWFDTLAECIKSLEEHFKSSVYACNWEDGIAFLEDPNVRDLLWRISPETGISPETEQNPLLVYYKYTDFYRCWQDIHCHCSKKSGHLLNFLRQQMIDLQESVGKLVEKGEVKDWEVADIPPKM